MDWRHETDVQWMRARAWHLNFADVKKLLPVTNTGRNRTVTEEDYWGVLGEKMKYVTQYDCISTGAAARGHILESYAVGAFNEFDKSSIYQMYHWDDIVVGPPDFGSLSFSPDALSIEPTKVIPSSQHGYFPMNEVFPYQLNKLSTEIEGLEVKSYGAGKIYQMYHEDKMKLEERWQIATAMVVLNNLEVMYLTLYNPSMQGLIWTIPYTRIDLENEIDLIMETESNWREFLIKNDDPNFSFASRVKYTWTHQEDNRELKIWEEYNEERTLSNRLDPI